MGQSTHLAGFKPADDKFNKMFKILKGCQDLGIDPPDEVKKYFGPLWEEVTDDLGVRVRLDPYLMPKGVRGWEAQRGEEWGIEVDLRELDPDIKILRFYNSI